MVDIDDFERGAEVEDQGNESAVVVGQEEIAVAVVSGKMVVVMVSERSGWVELVGKVAGDQNLVEWVRSGVEEEVLCVYEALDYVPDVVNGVVDNVLGDAVDDFLDDAVHDDAVNGVLVDDAVDYALDDDFAQDADEVGSCTDGGRSTAQEVDGSSVQNGIVVLVYLVEEAED